MMLLADATLVDDQRGLPSLAIRPRVGITSSPRKFN